MTTHQARHVLVGGRAPTSTRRLALSRRRSRIAGLVLAALAAGGFVLPTGARAAHPAGNRVFKEISRYLGPSARALHDHLAWVEISDAGPYALAHEVGGQEDYAVLRRTHGYWRQPVSISDQALACGRFPGAVVRDLHLKRDTDGWIPCG